MNVQSEHDWVGRRLAARRAGLLLEDETRFDSHLTDCEECRELYEDFVGRDDAIDALEGHIPSSMLARWDLVCRDSRGLERELLRGHLLDCEDCREDLQLAGFEPVLPEMPDVTHSIAPISSHPDWRQRSVTAWAVVATAAALTLFLWPDGQSERSEELMGRALPWVAPQSLRGEGVEILTVDHGALSTLLALRVPLADGTSPLLVDVLAPDGHRICSVPLSPGLVRHGTTMLQLTDPEGLQVGAYRVLYWRDETRSQGPLAEQGFEIRISEQP